LRTLRAIADWFTWCETLASEPAPGQETWNRERMEYSFAVSAQLPSGEVVLESPEYFEGRLDWYAFVRGSASLRDDGDREPAIQTFSRNVLPSPAVYPGMPAPRWWEFEDARVDFGSVDAGPPDLIRLLFVEFATVFGNDWFVIPIDRVPIGSLLRITSLRVTDVFGIETTVEPFAETGLGGAWHMFDIASPQGDGARDLLLLPTTVTAATESPPLEEVALVRDELANMGWAIERTVASASGRPLRRHEEYAETLRRSESLNGGATPAEAPMPVYRLMTGVPDYWIPLVPGVLEGSRRMMRAAMRRALPDGTLEPILPAGRVLEPETPTLRIHDEEVPPDGVRVTRAWQLARNAVGDTHLWLGRQKDAGTGQASSGLRFDVVEPATPSPM
jgi:hypothetical protein